MQGKLIPYKSDSNAQPHLPKTVSCVRPACLSLGIFPKSLHSLININVRLIARNLNELLS